MYLNSPTAPFVEKLRAEIGIGSRSWWLMITCCPSVFPLPTAIWPPCHINQNVRSSSQETMLEVDLWAYTVRFPWLLTYGPLFDTIINICYSDHASMAICNKRRKKSSYCYLICIHRDCQKYHKYSRWRIILLHFLHVQNVPTFSTKEMT